MWWYGNLITYVNIAVPWTMETFSRGRVCHVVPYTIHGNMATYIEVTGHVKNCKLQQLHDVWVLTFSRGKFCHFVIHILQSYMETCSTVQIAFIKNNSQCLSKPFPKAFIACMHIGYVTSSMAPPLLQFIALCKTSKRHVEIVFSYKSCLALFL